MPLVIHLRKNQQAVLNGAVIENVSGRTISIAIRNEAKVLRADDMLEPALATTCATRLYLELQGAYLDPQRTADHLDAVQAQLSACRTAAPDAAPLVAEIGRAVEGGNLYAALKAAQALIRHEGSREARGEGQTAGDATLAAEQQHALIRGDGAAIRQEGSEGGAGGG